MTTTPAPTDRDTTVETAARAIQAYQARTAFPPEQYTWDAIPQEWRDRHLAAARVMVEAVLPLLTHATPATTGHDTQAKAAVEAIEHLTSMMATNSRDWGAARDDAWFYGIAVGWGPDEDDPESEDALPKLAARHGWTPETQDRLRALRAGYASVPALLDELAKTRTHLAVEEQSHGETIDDREACHEAADKLAEAIAAAAGVDIGEHSNMNDPWANALDAMPKLVAELANALSYREMYGKLDAATVQIQQDRDDAREELAKVRAELASSNSLIGCLYAAGVDKWEGHAAAVQTYARFEAEANPATTAEPADEPKATVPFALEVPQDCPRGCQVWCKAYEEGTPCPQDATPAAG